MAFGEEVHFSCLRIQKRQGRVKDKGHGNKRGGVNVHAHGQDSTMRKMWRLDSMSRRGRNQACQLVLCESIGKEDNEFIYEYVHV